MQEKIYLRDDDISYFTDLMQLKMLYEPRFHRGLNVNFAVIPFAVNAEGIGDFDKLKYFRSRPRALWENQKLLDWLIHWHKKGHVGIALHGYTHEYHLLNGKWAPEHRKYTREFVSEIEHGLLSLRSFFDVNTYVPPSNGISLLGLLFIVYKFNLNISAPKSMRFLPVLKIKSRVKEKFVFRFKRNCFLYVTRPFYNTGLNSNVVTNTTVAYHYWEPETSNLLDDVLKLDKKYETW
ncbi:MAG: DUF2334 domain-containing protein [Bacteroidia bacterium]